MFDDFFRFETEFSYGDGFAMFGPYHLFWLLVILIGCIGSTKWYCKKSEEQKQKIKCIVGCVLPGMEAVRDIILFATGHFGRGFLPIHLCSIALIIACFYAWTSIRFFGVVYVTVCVPGAVAALVFPDWTMYPFFNYMHLHAFLAHGFTVAFGAWLLGSGEILIKWKDMGMSFLFGAFGFVFVHYVNQILGTNYWFLEIPSSGCPLIYIRKLVGAKNYRFSFFCICFFMIVLWQSMIINILQKWQNKKG